jgi:DNA-binding NtrC family response regulator
MSLDSTYTSQIYGLPTLSVPAPSTHWNQHNNRDSCESENNVPSEISSIRDGGPLEEVTALPSDVRDLEREHILSVLKRVNGHRKKAVEILGISERTLRYKLRQWREAGYLIP